MPKKCKYCGRPVNNKGNSDVCANCSSKLPAWRELYALACHIKKLAEIERKSRGG